MFLTHGDDDGIIMPPKIAPYQAVVIPIYKKGMDESGLASYVAGIASVLRDKKSAGEPVRTFVDDSAHTSPGRKFNTWEVRGVPIRIEIGESEMNQGSVTLVRRDTRENPSVRRIPSGRPSVRCWTKSSPGYLIRPAGSLSTTPIPWIPMTRSATSCRAPGAYPCILVR
jgi:hypothetical protein